MLYDHLFQGIPTASSAEFGHLCEFCVSHQVPVLASLPWLASDIAGIDGFPTMLVFIREFSGARLHVSANHARFRERLGIDISTSSHRRILIGAGHSQIVDVPSAWGVFLTLRRVAIQSALKEGAEVRQIARKFGVSERSLRHLPPQA